MCSRCRGFRLLAWASGVENDQDEGGVQKASQSTKQVAGGEASLRNISSNKRRLTDLPSAPDSEGCPQIALHCVATMSGNAGMSGTAFVRQGAMASECVERLHNNPRLTQHFFEGACSSTIGRISCAPRSCRP